MSKKIVTHKQHVILLLLLIFRFVNSKQIQEFLNHKDHRRINSWLKGLTEKEYIAREFKLIFGQLTKPAVYYLTAKGRSYLKKNYLYHFPAYLKRISRDHKMSLAFKIKCQIIADWYLTFFPFQEYEQTDTHIKGEEQKKAKNTVHKTGIDIVDSLIFQLTTDTEKEPEKIPYNTSQFFTASYYPSFPLLKTIKPDAYMRKKKRDGMTHALLFVFDSYVPRLLLRYRLQGIFKALNEENWEDDSISNLHLFFLCPNNPVIIYLRRALPRFFETYACGKPTHVHLATRNQLYSHKNGPTERIKWITLSSDDE